MKYKNKKVGRYDSRKEAARASYLKILERSGEIRELQEQVPFEILKTFKDSSGKTERGIKYIADFVYYDNKLRSYVIEDVKSEVTKKISSYIIKRKFVKFLFANYIFKEV